MTNPGMGRPPKVTLDDVLCAFAAGSYESGPSFRALGSTFDVSISTAFRYVERLQSRGLVEPFAKGEAHGYRLTEAGKRAVLHPESVAS